MSDNPYQPPEPSSNFRQRSEARNHPKLQGLEGWLALLFLGLLLRLADLAAGNLMALNMFEAAAQHPQIFPLASFRVLSYALLFIGNFAAIVLFFKKSFYFPKICIAYLLAGLAFSLADVFLAAGMPAIEAFTKYDTDSGFLRRLFGVLIWVPYLLVSKRVKCTFVKPVRH